MRPNPRCVGEPRRWSRAPDDPHGLAVVMARARACAVALAPRDRVSSNCATCLFVPSYQFYSYGFVCLFDCPVTSNAVDLLEYDACTIIIISTIYTCRFKFNVVLAAVHDSKVQHREPGLATQGLTAAWH
jgi:hypothetical protein